MAPEPPLPELSVVVPEPIAGRADLAPMAFLVGLVCGVVLLMLSVVARAHLIQYDGREVGYFTAINWSVNFVLVVPFGFFFLVSAVQAVEPAILELGRRGMIVDGRLARAGGEPLRADWRRMLQRGTKLAIAAGLLGILFSLYEWWDESGQYLLAGRVLTAGAERDWSVAPLLGGKDGAAGHTGTAALGVAAFTYQGVAVGAFFAFILLATGLGLFMARWTREGGPLRIIPNCAADDRRLGYEAFEPLLDRLLLAGLAFYVSFFLSHVWNNYLRSTLSMSDFLLGDIRTGLRDRDVTKVTGELLSLGDANYSSFMVVLGGALASVVIVFVVCFLLRDAAIRGRAIVRNHLDDGRPIPGLTISLEECRKKLSQMQVWPLAYLELNRMMALVVAALACLIFYRLGLWFVGAGVSMALRRARGSRSNTAGSSRTASSRSDVE